MKRTPLTSSFTLGVVVLITLFISSTSGQQPQMPNFKAPPGYTIKTETKSSTYNFYPMKRGIALPYDRMQLPASKLPKGFSFSKSFICPSPNGERFYNDPTNTMKTFGTPSRKSFQAFTGSGGEGVVLYFEYAGGLPLDAKDVLSKYFFNSLTPPEPNTQKEVEQFLVSDNVLVVWCFRNPKSAVRNAHQEYVFNLIAEVAQKK